MKNIIFDLGGVLLPIDEQYTIDAFISLAQQKKILKNLQVFYANSIIPYEIGEISDSDFIQNLNAILQIDETQNPEQTILKAWNKMLFDFPEENIKMLKKLCSKYRVFLLSNTNSLHIKHLQKTWSEQQPGEAFFLNIFEKAYLSYELKMRKPNKNIYEYVLKDANIDPNQTLFVDDRKENTEAAKLLGIQTYLHPSNKSLPDKLADLGIF